VSELDHTHVPVSAETRQFWEGCKRGELLYQFCLGCNRSQFYPRQHCVDCQGARLEWRVSRREGTIYTFTNVSRAPTAAFRANSPYIVALIDLDEGFRMMMNIRGTPAERLEIGQRVTVRFDRRDNGDVLPIAEVAP